MIQDSLASGSDGVMACSGGGVLHLPRGCRPVESWMTGWVLFPDEAAAGLRLCFV